jgi:opacity protein-like surface antigen
LQFRVGVAADFIGPNSLLSENQENRLGAAIDIFQPNDYSQQIHAGIEYEYAHTLALRIGYKYNYDSEGLTFGGGIEQVVSGIHLTVDYSYGSMGTYIGSFGNTHRISLGVELQ